MQFNELALSEPTLKAISEQGYTTPTAIQSKAIPAVLSGKDVLAAAQTGTGKTASFVLPMIEKLMAPHAAQGSKASGAQDDRAQNRSKLKSNHARSLILAPTRELALQIEESLNQYAKYHNLRSLVVFGGVKINPQLMGMRKGVDILIATPGRLLDLCEKNAVKFYNLEVLVLDEADRMLDMGFIRDIQKIIKLLPNKRQTLLFSATFSKSIRSLAQTIVKNPIEIQTHTENTTAKVIKQVIHPVDKKRKSELLLELITHNRWQQALVFTKTKHGANKLSRYLDSYGVKSSAIHGNKSQAARVKALSQFKSGTIDILVATDIAARGLDIDQLPHVVNFDLPNVPEDYVHRVGRTGRAGATGEAVSLVSADEIKQLTAIERLISKKLKRTLIDGFVPTHDLPTDFREKPNQQSKKNGNSGNSNIRGNGGNGGNNSSSTKNRNRKPKSGQSHRTDNPSPNARSKRGGPKRANGPKTRGSDTAGASKKRSTETRRTSKPTISLNKTPK